MTVPSVDVLLGETAGEAMDTASFRDGDNVGWIQVRILAQRLHDALVEVERLRARMGMSWDEEREEQRQRAEAAEAKLKLYRNACEFDPDDGDTDETTAAEVERLWGAESDRIEYGVRQYERGSKQAKHEAEAKLERAVAEEREACAVAANSALSFHSYAGGVAAAAIRARGTKP